MQSSAGASGTVAIPDSVDEGILAAAIQAPTEAQQPTISGIIVPAPLEATPTDIPLVVEIGRNCF